MHLLITKYISKLEGIFGPCDVNLQAWGSLSLLYNGYRVLPGCQAAGAWR